MVTKKAVSRFFRNMKPGGKGTMLSALLPATAIGGGAYMAAPYLKDKMADIGQNAIMSAMQPYMYGALALGGGGLAAKFIHDKMKEAERKRKMEAMPVMPVMPQQRVVPPEILRNRMPPMAPGGMNEPVV